MRATFMRTIKAVFMTQNGKSCNKVFLHNMPSSQARVWLKALPVGDFSTRDFDLWPVLFALHAAVLVFASGVHVVVLVEGSYDRLMPEAAVAAAALGVEAVLSAGRGRLGLLVDPVVLWRRHVRKGERVLAWQGRPLGTRGWRQSGQRRRRRLPVVITAKIKNMRCKYLENIIFYVKSQQTVVHFDHSF